MVVVVDASVAIKWFVEEPGSGPARRLWREASELMAPDILVAEVCNAAWKKLRRQEISAAQADALAQLLVSGPVTYKRTHVLAPRAFAIALALGHPVYDCFYLALCEAQGCAMVTADRRLVTRLEGSPWQGLVKGLDQTQAPAS